ncbi:MAG: Ig-like domain-containing protein, partial [Candidatus Geothermarchaeales archaeon]
AMEYLEKLGLDFSVMTLPPVYVDLKTRSGVTWWEKYNGFYSTDTAIYEPAFANPSILISTVMHEWVHPTQVEECKTTTMSSNALEVEAYLTELERSEETGLAKWTAQNRKHWDQIKLQLKKHYDLLKPEEKEIFEDRYKKVMETLPGVASTITLYINPTSTTLGEQITINGSLYPPQEAPVAIEYSMDGGSTWTAFATVTSAPDGSYSYTWKATSAGTYLVRASWPGDAHRMGATEVKTLTVEGGQAKASISNVQFMSLAGGTLTASSPYAETPLEMRIEAVKEEYPLDGPINILVTIRNIGSATVTLNQRMAVNREEAPEEFRELAFHVVKPSGEKAKFKAFINIDFPSEEDFIKLEENSAIERMVDITTHHYYYTKLYDMYEPDVYTLKATYSNQESGYYEWNGTAWVKVELGAWRGKLESNTIEIKIVEEEKQTNWLIWAALGSAFAIGGAFLFLGRRGPSKPTSPTQVPGEEAKALNVVRGFLDQMRVRYSLDPAQNTLISRGWGVEGKVFTIVVGISGPWVVVRAIILAKDRIPTEAEPDIYKRMLEVSYSYPELRYDVDGEGNLGTTQTMPIAGLNLENFKSEFTAVLDAIKHFVTDIAPKFEIEL